MPSQTTKGFCSYFRSSLASKRAAVGAGARRRRVNPLADDPSLEESASMFTAVSPLARAICARRLAPAKPCSVSMSSSVTPFSSPESMCAFSDSCAGMSGPMSRLGAAWEPRPPPRRLAIGEITYDWNGEGSR